MVGTGDSNSVIGGLAVIYGGITEGVVTVDDPSEKGVELERVSDGEIVDGVNEVDGDTYAEDVDCGGNVEGEDVEGTDMGVDEVESEDVDGTDMGVDVVESKEVDENGVKDAEPMDVEDGVVVGTNEDGLEGL